MRAVQVKICGITRPEDAEAAIAAGADLLGFVLVSGTPRAVDPERAGWIRDGARGRGVGTVGVFRDQPLDLVLELRRRLGLDRVQLHGAEPDAWMDALGDGVLRRVPVADGRVDWRRVEMLAQRCLPLVDPGAGDGVAAAWDALGRPRVGTRFGVAGGLTAETVAEVVRRLRPALVDVSSGVEASPGVKDHERVAAFVAAARGACREVG